jgi:hypothetical protein
MKFRYQAFVLTLAISFFVLAKTPATQAGYDRQEGLPGSQPQSVEDPIPPSVTWVLPVSEGAYTASGEVVLLEAEAADDVGVEWVHFSRWDAVSNAYVEVATLYEAPYQAELDTSSLNPEWNEIFARAYDTGGNASLAESIFIYVDGLIAIKQQLYLPYVGRLEP